MFTLYLFRRHAMLRHAFAIDAGCSAAMPRVDYFISPPITLRLYFHDSCRFIDADASKSCCHCHYKGIAAQALRLAGFHI